MQIGKGAHFMLNREQLADCEQAMIDALGYENLYEALSKAMSCDDLEDYLAYISRVYEIETPFEMEERR